MYPALHLVYPRIALNNVQCVTCERITPYRATCQAHEEVDKDIELDTRTGINCQMAHSRIVQFYVI